MIRTTPCWPPAFRHHAAYLDGSSRADSRYRPRPQTSMTTAGDQRGRRSSTIVCCRSSHLHSSLPLATGPIIKDDDDDVVQDVEDDLYDHEQRYSDGDVTNHGIIAHRKRNGSLLCFPHTARTSNTEEFRVTASEGEQEGPLFRHRNTRLCGLAQGTGAAPFYELSEVRVTDFLGCGHSSVVISAATTTAAGTTKGDDDDDDDYVGPESDGHHQPADDDLTKIDNDDDFGDSGGSRLLMIRDEAANSNAQHHHLQLRHRRHSSGSVHGLTAIEQQTAAAGRLVDDERRDLTDAELASAITGERRRRQPAGRRSSEEIAVKAYLKTCRDDKGESAMDDFHREYSMLSLCRHPGIVGLKGWGCSGGQCALIMEHLTGGTLREAIKEEERISLDRHTRFGTCEDVTPEAAPHLQLLRRFQWALQIGKILSHLHRKRVVHGAITPDHIMFRDSRTDPGELVLVDFTNARLRESHGSKAASLMTCSRDTFLKKGSTSREKPNFGGDGSPFLPMMVMVGEGSPEQSLSESLQNDFLESLPDNFLDLRSSPIDSGSAYFPTSVFYSPVSGLQPHGNQFTYRKEDGNFWAPEVFFCCYKENDSCKWNKEKGNSSNRPTSVSFNSASTEASELNDSAGLLPRNSAEPIHDQHSHRNRYHNHPSRFNALDQFTSPYDGDRHKQSHGIQNSEVTPRRLREIREVSSDLGDSSLEAKNQVEKLATGGDLNVAAQLPAGAGDFLTERSWSMRKRSKKYANLNSVVDGPLGQFWPGSESESPVGKLPFEGWRVFSAVSDLMRHSASRGGTPKNELAEFPLEDDSGNLGQRKLSPERFSEGHGSAERQRNAGVSSPRYPDKMAENGSSKCRCPYCDCQDGKSEVWQFGLLLRSLLGGEAYEPFRGMSKEEILKHFTNYKGEPLGVPHGLLDSLFADLESFIDYKLVNRRLSRKTSYHRSATTNLAANHQICRLANSVDHARGPNAIRISGSAEDLNAVVSRAISSKNGIFRSSSLTARHQLSASHSDFSCFTDGFSDLPSNNSVISFVGELGSRKTSNPSKSDKSMHTRRFGPFANKMLISSLSPSMPNAGNLDVSKTTTWETGNAAAADCGCEDEEVCARRDMAALAMKLKPQIVQLLHRCLSFDPEERPSMPEVEKVLRSAVRRVQKFYDSRIFFTRRRG